MPHNELSDITFLYHYSSTSSKVVPIQTNSTIGKPRKRPNYLHRLYHYRDVPRLSDATDRLLFIIRYTIVLNLALKLAYLTLTKTYLSTFYSLLIQSDGQTI